MKTKTMTGSHIGGEVGYWEEQPWSIGKAVFEIKHRLWMLQIRSELHWWHLEDKIRRLLHCRWGFHRTTPCSTVVTRWYGKKEIVKQTKYLKCTACGLLQFPTVEDRTAYLEIKADEKIMAQKLFDAAKKRLGRKK